MAHRPTPLLLLPGQAFSYADAIRSGMTPGMLRAAGFAAPFRGARCIPHASSDTQTPHQRWREAQLLRARAYAAVMQPHQFFFGATAAVVLGLPVPSSFTDNNLRVGVHAPRRSVRRPTIVPRQFRPAFAGVCVHDGLRVLTAASLWATFGPQLGFDDRVALGDAIVRTPRVRGRAPRPGRPSLATRSDLLLVAETRNRPGRSKLFEALEHIRDGASSPPETCMRLRLASAGLTGFELDYDVHSPEGVYLGTSEIAFPEQRVALEYEGDHHRVERKQWYRDIEKYHQYGEAGWVVVRVTAELLFARPDELIERIQAALARQGWRLSE